MELLNEACETSCSHAFCAPCLLECWRSAGQDRMVSCPVCRSPVRFIVASTTLRSVCNALAPAESRVAAAARAAAARQRDADIGAYNAHFAAGADRSLLERAVDGFRITLSGRSTVVVFYLAVVAVILTKAR